jgi:hypothetical protein
LCVTPKTRPHSEAPEKPVTRLSGACIAQVTLGHQLVYIVVIAIFQAGADASRPHGPLAVADAPLSECSDMHAISMERISEVQVLRGDRLFTSNYADQQVA